MAGKRAISSADFEELDNNEHQSNLNKFSGATAISSDAFFGNGPEETTSEEGRDSLTGQIADKAVVVADGVVAGAKKFGGWLSSIRSTE